MSPALEAWGGIRPRPGNALPTDYTFTGQKLDAQSGLMYYVARWYDPQVGRFLSADSIVPEPGEPQSLNRFAYVSNNPVVFADPTGHAKDPGGAYASSEEEAYLAYQAAASALSQELGPYLGAYVAEYLASVAVYHYNMWKEGPDSPNTQLLWTIVLNNHQGVVVNGRYDVDSAVSTAWERGGGELSAGLGIATGLWSLVCPPVWGSLEVVPNPYGINGAPDHQAAVEKLEDMARKEFAERDVVIQRNKSILGRLGQDRRPDVSVWNANTAELLKVYEAARVDSRGNFVPREQQKMFEYWEAGIPYWFEEVK